MRRGTPAAVLAAVVAALLSACSPNASPTLDYSEPFAQQARNELERARDTNASDAQLTILERAAEQGNMTFEDAEEAIQNTFACWDRAGVPHSALASAGSSGYPEVQYTFGGVPGLTDSESLAVANACLNAESFFVERLYTSTPGFNDTLSRAFAPNAPAYAECMTDAGVALDPDVTYEQALSVIDSAMAEGIDISACYRYLP